MHLCRMLQDPSLLGAGTSDLSDNISKNIRNFIQTSPGFWEPRLRNDSRPSYPHSALLWFLPAGIFCFPELDVFFILEGSLFMSLREYKWLKTEIGVFLQLRTKSERRWKMLFEENLKVQPEQTSRDETKRMNAIACLLTTAGIATDLGDISSRL